jgi:hypothetical protein
MLHRNMSVAAEALPVIGLGTWGAFYAGASDDVHEPVRRSKKLREAATAV